MSGSVVKVWKITGSGNNGAPPTRRMLEESAQTFLAGTPVALQASDGMVIASPTLSSALKIIGFSQEPGSNLTTQGTPKTLTYGSVENQPAAVLIPGGAPPNDGRVGINVATDEVLFIGVMKSDQTPAATSVGLIYGMTKDATSLLWYIDTAITAAANGAIFEIIEIPVIPGDPLAPATPVAGGKVVFKVTKAGQQFSI